MQMRLSSSLLALRALNVDRLVQLTSADGPVQRSQRRALESMEVWLKLFDAARR